MGWVTGPDRIDELCNTLYGNSTYATETRNMKIEDINRVLEYDGPLGMYHDEDLNPVTTGEAMTFREIEAAEGLTISNRLTPKLSTIAFDDCLSNYRDFRGETYKDDTSDEYRVLFASPGYWLSSRSSFIDFHYDFAYFYIGTASYGLPGWVKDCGSMRSDGLEYEGYFHLRPVIVLKSNIQFGEKNSSGEWTLVEM